MTFVPAPPASVAAFGGIVVLVVGCMLVAVHRAYGPDTAAAWRATRYAALVIATWLGLWATLVTGGVMPRLPLNGLPFFFGGVIASGVIVGCSGLGRRLAHSLPLAALVGFQGFRLPLELVLHQWVEAGTIPATMTWTGRNWDIFAGGVALLATPFAGRSRALAWAANLVGCALLANVARVALLSSPVPFGWQVEPPLQLALHAPYFLIGPVCVGGALAGHIVLTRALLASQPGPAAVRTG